MPVKRLTVLSRVFEMWQRLPLKTIFVAVLCIIVIHVFFVDEFDYGTHGITRIGVHIPGGGRIQLTGTPKAHDDEEYIAFCMAVKDQSDDLREFFVHHYHHIGIRRFYIMDDGSDPPLSTVTDYGIPNSAINFHYYNEADRVDYMQMNIYNQCNEWYGKNHTWIAYFDADEFLEIVSPEESLMSILKEFEKNNTIGALGVNWRMHTSSNLETRPDSARQSFTTCIYDDDENNGEASDNRHVKSIVRTDKYLDAINPHTFNLKDGAHMVGEDGEYVNHWAFRQPITRNRVSLHHYAVKSWEEYEAKMNRSNAMGNAKDMEFWNHVKDIPHVECPEMTAYHP